MRVWSLPGFTRETCVGPHYRRRMWRGWIAWLALVTFAGRAHADDDPVRLRLGTLAVDGSRYALDIEAFGADVTRRTRGAVVIDWVTGGQLGDDAAMANQIESGQLDGAGLSETGLTALVPEMAAWAAPGLVHDATEADRATAAVSTDVQGRFARRGLVFLMWADLGFARLFSTAAVTGVASAVEAAEPWLAHPLDGQLTAAIGEGRAIGWAMPPLHVLALPRIPRATMVDLPFRYVVGGLVVSRAAWSRLDAQQQAAVMTACRHWEPRLRRSWRRETDRAVGALQRAGVTRRAPTPAESARFFDATRRRNESAAGRAPEGLLPKILAARTAAVSPAAR